MSTLLAHLSDLHIIEDGYKQRRPAARWRLSCLSLLRPLDPTARRSRVLRAFAQAREACPDHMVITGDLTEDGTEEQFEVLAGLLAASGFPPSSITLVPGNHDGYHDTNAWAKALAGPLSAYAPTSTPGTITLLHNMTVIAVSTVLSQFYLRSAGVIDPSQLDTLEHALACSRDQERAVIVAQHHPPLPSSFSAFHWVYGLQGHRKLRPLLEGSPHVHVLHGHTHQLLDRPFHQGSEPRIFSCPAVVDHPAPLRLYRVHRGKVTPYVPAAPLCAA